MCEFGSWEEAATNSWKESDHDEVGRPCETKDAEGHVLVRCRLVAPDVKPRHEGPREELSAAMRPLEANRVLFTSIAGTRRARRNRGEDEVTLKFEDVKKTHLDARCDELGDGCTA